MKAPLLRVATAGSVDDGKSTLIGRLLWDSKSILEDQAASVAHASAVRGQHGTNMAMFTDGLRAERERGITIDVAYRYFATPRRRFVLADTPGHFEFTRNMVTGASNADLAIILIDARHGVVDQTRRHAVIAGLLCVPHVVVAVNKMDLVGWDQEVFAAITKDFCRFADPLELPSLTFFPISALAGDNVVEPSTHMDWHDGPPLLQYLEDVAAHADPAEDPIGARLAVQWVLPAGEDVAASYAGQVAAGVLRRGADVMVLPSGVRSKVAEIHSFTGPVDEAREGTPVTVRLTDGAPVVRGDLLCQPGVVPEVADGFDAVVCWFAEEPLVPGTSYAIKHGTRWDRATVAELRHRLDIETLVPDGKADRLGPNDIGTLRISLSTPIAFDAYRHNRNTGSFILVDEATNATVAAGMILGVV